jgi:hypothetical protein
MGYTLTLTHRVSHTTSNASVIIACHYCVLIVLSVVEDYITLLLSTHLLVHIVRMDQHGLASVICASIHHIICITFTDRRTRGINDPGLVYIYRKRC